MFSYEQNNVNLHPTNDYGTCIMLGDGEMLKDAHQRHHHDAHAQLLHDR